MIGTLATLARLPPPCACRSCACRTTSGQVARMAARAASRDQASTAVESAVRVSQYAIGSALASGDT